MMLLLVCEYREGKLAESSYELLAFADRLGAERAMVLIGSEAHAPNFSGKVYLADVATYGEYNPAAHKALVLEAAKNAKADAIVFIHSAYGWDMAPRVAAALRAGLVTEIVDIVDDKYSVPCFNSKLRRIVSVSTSCAVLTIQAGAFNSAGMPQGTPDLEVLEVPPLPEPAGHIAFSGYQTTVKKGVDLSRAEVIVSVGRGIGKKENIPLIEALAQALGGQLGATRPVVDAGWLDHSFQVGSTGQIVHPKLYVACGISGSIQHLAGMKKSEFIVAINKDKEAPIGAVADVLVVADLMQFVPALTTVLLK
jgi:electron transfer flavoprotein alpha subunit